MRFLVLLSVTDFSSSFVCWEKSIDFGDSAACWRFLSDLSVRSRLYRLLRKSMLVLPRGVWHFSLIGGRD